MLFFIKTINKLFKIYKNSRANNLLARQDFFWGSCFIPQKQNIEILCRSDCCLIVIGIKGNLVCACTYVNVISALSEGVEVTTKVDSP